MSEQINQPLPLKGPIRPLDVFFTSRTAPLTAMRPTDTRTRVIQALLCSPLVLLLWFLQREVQGHGSLEFQWVMMMLFFLFTEFGIKLLGVSLAQRGMGEWIKNGRLAEMCLTSMRPLEIGQLIIAQQRLVMRVLLWVWIGYTTSLIFYQTQHLYFAVTSGILLTNAAINLRLGGWLGITHRVGLGRGMKEFVSIVQADLVIVLAFAPIIIFLVVYSTVVITTLGQINEDLMISLNFHTMILLAAPFHWTIKYLLARGFAARLEQVVLPQCEM